MRTKWRAITASMFSGNSFNADPMTPYVRAAAGIMDWRGDVVAAVHSAKDYPPNLGVQFPAAGKKAHLDVHLTCEPNGAACWGSLTVWYTLDPP